MTDVKGIVKIKCKVEADNAESALAKVKDEFPGFREYSCAGQLRNGLWLVEVRP